VDHACRQCAARIPFAPDPDAPGCPTCLGQRWHFETAVALGRYENVFRRAVLRTKLPAEEPLTRTLGRLLISRHADALRGFKPDLIVPIPMHWRRRWVRSVNNAEVIARVIGGLLKAPCKPRVLKRQRLTAPHGQLSHRQRQENIRGAFSVRHAALVRNRRILLIDDILTTGATCNEAAKMLRQAGAAAVAVAVIARAQPTQI
jgi:ComF family protein